jgi:putative PIN family toxin of toxin-antitoxin system
VRLVVSDSLEEEYRRAVEYPQVVRFSAKVNRQAFVSAVVAAADRVIPGEAKGLVARDPSDDLVLAAAIGGRAEWVVSLDRDLIDLVEVGGIRILRPGDFLVELRRLDG